MTDQIDDRPTLPKSFEPVTRSLSVSTLVEQLAQAQAKFLPINRNRDVEVKLKSGGEYHYSYATLDEVLRCTVPALTAHKIAHWWDVRQKDQLLRVTAYLALADEWISSTLVAAAQSSDPQQIASVLTYLKRYTYQNVVGVTAEEDTDVSEHADGHAVTTPRHPATRPAAKVTPPATGAPAPSGGSNVRVVTEKQVGLIRARMRDLSLDKEDVLAHVRNHAITLTQHAIDIGKLRPEGAEPIAHAASTITTLDALPMVLMDGVLKWFTDGAPTDTEETVAEREADDPF